MDDMYALFKSARQFISFAFNKHLFMTNVFISMTLSGTGDIMLQRFQIAHNARKKWDKTRTRNMSCTGITVGVLCHHWYHILDARLPGQSFKIVMKKVIVDQLFFSPICLVVYLLTLNILKSKGKQRWQNTLKDMQFRGFRLYLSEWLIWPPAQLINFYFLSTKYRVLYDNTISLLYDIYGSHVCNDIDCA